MALGAGNGGDDQPHCEQNRCDFRDLPPTRRIRRGSRGSYTAAKYLENRRLNALPVWHPAHPARFSEKLAQPSPAAMQPRHHSADRALHDPGDLLVAEALDVGKVDGHPEVVGKLPQRLRDPDIRHVVQGQVLRGAHAPAVCDWTRASCQSSIRAVLTTGSRCLLRQPLMNVFVRMRFSQALRFVPSLN